MFSQGEEGTSWYIILKGSVNVVIYGKVSVPHTVSKSIDADFIVSGQLIDVSLHCPVLRALFALSMKETTLGRSLWSMTLPAPPPSSCERTTVTSWGSTRRTSTGFWGWAPLLQSTEGFYRIYKNKSTIALCWQKLSNVAIKGRGSLLPLTIS